MDRSDANVLPARRSGKAGRPDYISISSGGKLRYSKGFIEKNRLSGDGTNAVVLHYDQDGGALGFRFLYSIASKEEGARVLHKKKDGSYELYIGGALKQIGLRADAVRGKYEAHKDKVGREWRYHIDLRAPLA